MFKLSAIVILALAIYVQADPVLRKPLRRPVFARQQVQSTPASSGYPAAGVTPEIPFELPTETEKPNVAQQPDQTYGPPELNAQQPDERAVEAAQPNDIYGPPETDAEPQLDEVYGAPESETIQPAIGFSLTEIEDVPEIITEIDEPVEEGNEDEEEVIIDGDGAVISVSSTFEKPARLVYQRFPQRRQFPKAVPARLTNAKIVKNSAGF